METQSLRLGEVAHLVMSFLKDERVSFPATRAAFELEARDVLKTVKPGRRGVKTLFEILDEYLQLKQECKDREDRKKCFKEDPVAAQQVERVMADMVALLDEYRLLRTVQREVEVGRANKTADQPASGLAMKAGGGPPTGATGLPQGSTPETCRKTALLNTAGLGPAAPQTAAQPTGREFVGSDTGSSADVGRELMRRGVENGAVPVEPESEVRDTKRRKRCPVRHNRNSSTCAEASGHNDPPANTRIGGTRCVNGFMGGDQEGTQSVERDCHATPEGAQTCFAPTSSQSITGGAGTLTDKGAEEGQEPTGNVYSDISESVLCDPQVCRKIYMLRGQIHSSRAACLHVPAHRANVHVVCVNLIHFLFCVCWSMSDRFCNCSRTQRALRICLPTPNLPGLSNL